MVVVLAVVMVMVMKLMMMKGSKHLLVDTGRPVEENLVSSSIITTFLFYFTTALHYLSHSATKESWWQNVQCFRVTCHMSLVLALLLVLAFVLVLILILVVVLELILWHW